MKKYSSFLEKKLGKMLSITSKMFILFELVFVLGGISW
jgi:hypothetical protein